MSLSSQPHHSSPVPLHPRPLRPSASSSSPSPNSPLPTVIQTPSGLALLELQGTINLPAASSRPAQDGQTQQLPPVTIGRLHFPDYRPPGGGGSENDTAWMKRVWMYVGGTQRLQGEVKKLPRAVAILRRRDNEGVEKGRRDDDDDGEVGDVEALEVAEIVKWKVVFSSRPEPVVEGCRTE
ncbi:hypothetical protein VTJ83DRAFT_6595 [Remersonia thermophila]|uniref:Chromosome transmission fidelity protein 8 n=1 Tax=Remersonia thermophila TaxID=72144 RepID=A0ABR4D562_9PEZI